MPMNTENIDHQVVTMKYTAETLSYAKSVNELSIVDYFDGDRVFVLRPKGSRYTNYRFSFSNKAHYIMAIDKYLKWEKTATNSAELLDKNITTISTVGNHPENTVIFDFRFKSVDTNTHLLSVNFCSLSHGCNDPELEYFKIFFDTNNAEKFKYMLTNYL